MSTGVSRRWYWCACLRDIAPRDAAEHSNQRCRGEKPPYAREAVLHAQSVDGRDASTSAPTQPVTAPALLTARLYTAESVCPSPNGVRVGGSGRRAMGPIATNPIAARPLVGCSGWLDGASSSSRSARVTRVRYCSKHP